MIEIGEVIKAILDEEFGIQCENVSIYLKVFGRLRKVEDPRVLLLSPYDSYMVSVTSLTWVEGGEERSMESLDISCNVSRSGRVHKEYKVVGRMDSRYDSDLEWDESVEELSTKAMNAFGRCVRRTRRFWVFRHK